MASPDRVPNLGPPEHAPSRPQIALVGIGALFPKASDPEAFWEIVRDARCTARRVPDGRWPVDPANVLGPFPADVDRVNALSGCYLDPFVLDPDGLDLPRGLLDGLDPTFHVVLEAGRMAWRDAVTGPLDHNRVGVVLGHIALPTDSASTLAWELRGLAFKESLIYGNEVVLNTTSLVHPWNRYVAGLPAGLLARALGLGGGAFALDAACASSLYALKLAADALIAGRADAMLAGGLSRPDALYTQMGFAQLRALSTKGIPTPFDHRADGLVVGEGAGLFVLKRLDDALRHGDTIHALLAGVGLSNDVEGNLLAPASEGQIRALRAAYDQAGWSPTQVDLIECHATGTPMGDAVEFASLRALHDGLEFNADKGRNPTVVGSVKSNIGHPLTAAGAAGVLKVLLALRHRTLPPTASFSEPNPAIADELRSGRFAILREPRPWTSRTPETPRRAAVSGFGFGGINAHLLLEEYPPATAHPDRTTTRKHPVSIGSIRAPDRARLDHASQSLDLAVVGVAARVGPWTSTESVHQRLLGLEGPPAQSPSNWWGLPGVGTQVHAIPHLNVPLGRFRIPPRELEQALPQQLLALLVMAEAVGDRPPRWSARDRERIGVFLGVELDLNTTNYQLRWRLGEHAGAWGDRAGFDWSLEDKETWFARWREAISPPLTADRTLGGLASIAASRIARLFQIGGPSFTVSRERASGLQALAMAADALTHGQLDYALVGAVDFATEARAVDAARRAVSPSLLPECSEPPPLDVFADGAVAFVLRRLDDARREGEPILAVIESIETNPVNGPDTRLNDHKSFLRSSQCFGDLGAASGAFEVLSAIWSLTDRVIPPEGTVSGSRPRYAIGNRNDGPRRVRVETPSMDRTVVAATLREADPAPISDRNGPPGRPIRPLQEGLFLLEANSIPELLAEIDRLRDWVGNTNNAENADPVLISPIDQLGSLWWHRHAERFAPIRSAKLGAALVASNLDELAQLADQLRDAITRGDDRPLPGDRIFFEASPIAPGSKPVFAYPGSGNHFPRMGRDLAGLWPAILDKHHAQNRFLADQLRPDIFWDQEDLNSVESDHVSMIQGQISLGAFLADLLDAFDVRPASALGYSLGETTMLVAHRVWNDRDLMLERLRRSSLFTTDLAAPYNAARTALGLAPDDPFDWYAALIARSTVEVHDAIGSDPTLHILFITGDRECVLAGPRVAVERVAEQLGVRAVRLPGVSAVHCPLAQPVADAYRDLHRLPTRSVSGIRFYSAAWGRPFVPDSETAASAITDQALATVDIPRLVRRAWDDGHRLFLEIGPGASTTRMITSILRDRPHRARALHHAGADPVSLLLRTLGWLHAQRVPLRVDDLFDVIPDPSLNSNSDRTIRVPVGSCSIEIPKPLRKKASSEPVSPETNGSSFRTSSVSTIQQPSTSRIMPPQQSLNSPDPMNADTSQPRPSIAPLTTAAPPVSKLVDSEDGSRTGGDHRMVEATPLLHAMAANARAQASAHAAYLTFTDGIATTYADHASRFNSSFALPLLHNDSGTSRDEAHPKRSDPRDSSALHGGAAQPERSDIVLDRDQCLEFARGSIAAVLGPDYADIDAYPTRVRLPDEPLMLVDRITALEGEPRSLSHGRVVTEHDIDADRWYLDANAIPTALAVESGQADLFLAGYLGIDLRTLGRSVYRLLDAFVTFHDRLPGPGQTIRYDIRILNFFRQGNTYLFRFEFDGTVDGRPLLTMRDGCAGFFSAEELAAGKGLVLNGPRAPRDAKAEQLSADPFGFVPFDDPISLNESAVDRLRAGDLAGAFGPSFAELDLPDPYRLPTDKLRLVDRITKLDPRGGRFGLGLAVGEAEIEPDAWFLTCHFVDDQVMPGTLMYECCLHTFRVFLMRRGIVGPQGTIRYEPIPGISSRLRCRGQVTAQSSRVRYEIHVKAVVLSDDGTPEAIADAIMFADDKPIVEIVDMTIRASGVTRDGLERLWDDAREQMVPARPVDVNSYEQILEFATGRPSLAFGPDFAPFDDDRFMARLPRPPYAFLHRIVRVDNCQPGVLSAGGTALAEYDVPSEAWYFSAERTGAMPLSILLEVALQPCGWMSAYLGAALSSNHPLHYRNLGGEAIQHRAVTPDIGTLATRITLTKQSQSAGMIIQHFDFEVVSRSGPVYSGSTYFGFFRPEQLADQVGLRDPRWSDFNAQPFPDMDRPARPYPTEPPFPQAQLRMVDRIRVDRRGGDQPADASSLKRLRGEFDIDPSSWFFRAHFFQDPVIPGSLGLESLIQLLKLAVVSPIGSSALAPTVQFAPALGLPAHRWTYRGQVIPNDGMVTIDLLVTHVDPATGQVRGDGWLLVDGRLIYQMQDFAIAWTPTANEPDGKPISRTKTLAASRK